MTMRFVGRVGRFEFEGVALYYSGYDDDEWFTLFYSGFGGIPGRPIGVVLDAAGGVDEEATRGLRDTMRRERSEPGLFHDGDTIENILARYESETGLPPPSPPDFEDSRLPAKNPVIAGRVRTLRRATGS